MKYERMNPAGPDVRTVVVGGGAAGMMAAIIAAARGEQVTLIERNDRLGKKLGITGKGRCNLTNDCAVPEFLEHITHGGRFLMSALSRFSPRDAMAFFESLGLPLITERGRRVFPASQRAQDVTHALTQAMEQQGVRVVCDRVRDVTIRDGRVYGVRLQHDELSCDRVIVATGGLSYPKTGSTGDGYAIARSAGHTVTPPRASLVPLVARGDLCARMQGLSLRNVGLKVLDDLGQTLFQEQGEMLFTHFGVSGPLVLTASAHMDDYEHRRYTLSIDLKPALSSEMLDARLLRDFGKYHNRAYANALGDLLHRTMIPVIIELSGIDPETRIHSITRDQRKVLLALLKNLPVAIEGPRPVDEAIVTAGGVNLKEIHPGSMESKLVRGLYFAGEVLDIDGDTGGYNLQIAWSTGFAAGNAEFTRIKLNNDTNDACKAYE